VGVSVGGRARELWQSVSRSFPGRVLQKFAADRAANHAVLIAWNVLFALFPITLALAVIGGTVLSSAGVRQDNIERAVLSFIPSEAGASQAVGAVRGAGRHAGLFGLIALVGFLWSASSLFGVLEYSLGELLGIAPRNFIRGKLMSLAMMVVFVVLTGIGVATSTVVDLLTHLSIPMPALLQGALAPVMQAVVGVLVGFVLFFAIYYVVPNRRQHPAEVWPGAFFAGVGFELLTLLFPLYVRLNRGLNEYGSTFALLFILLTFLYFLGLLVVLGAEINAVRRLPRGDGVREADPGRVPARGRRPSPGL
jgi:YihY family inner membrane protein